MGHLESDCETLLMKRSATRAIYGLNTRTDKVTLAPSECCSDNDDIVNLQNTLTCRCCHHDYDFNDVVKQKSRTPSHIPQIPYLRARPHRNPQLTNSSTTRTHSSERMPYPCLQSTVWQLTRQKQ